MLRVQGNTRSKQPEEEGVCTLFLLSLRNVKAKYRKRSPSDVLQISTSAHFAVFPSSHRAEKELCVLPVDQAQA